MGNADELIASTGGRKEEFHVKISFEDENIWQNNFSILFIRFHVDQDVVFANYDQIEIMTINVNAQNISC